MIIPESLFPLKGSCGPLLELSCQGSSNERQQLILFSIIQIYLIIYLLSNASLICCSVINLNPDWVIWKYKLFHNKNVIYNMCLLALDAIKVDELLSPDYELLHNNRPFWTFAYQLVMLTEMTLYKHRLHAQAGPSLLNSCIPLGHCSSSHYKTTV